MKNKFKKHVSSVIGILIALNLIAPITIYAEEKIPNPKENLRNKNIEIKKDATRETFCEKIISQSGKATQKITQQKQKVNDKQKERENNLKQKRDERDQKLEDHRDKRDTNRDEHFTKLDERAKTDEQKQAVVQFKKDVEVAITARRVAIDTAIKNFREGVENTIASRKTEVEILKNNYENAVKEAYAQAQTDCKNGKTASEIRTILLAKLKTARENLVNGKKSLEEKNKETMKNLIEAKKTAFEKAISDFKTAMQTAKEKLKN